jgi:hypothetical protein
MKFYKYNLWISLDSENQYERENAEKEWEYNICEYIKNFEHTKRRLTKKFLKVYENHDGFHDFRFKKLSINNRGRNVGDPTNIALYIVNRKEVYKIIYKGVKKFSTGYEQGAGQRGIDDLCHDELLVVDDKLLSHELLFASGTTMLFWFQKISLEKLKVDLETFDESLEDLT